MEFLSKDIYRSVYMMEGVMIGKFLKKLLSAAMCAALIAGVGYSTDRLMGELSGVVFADEAEQTDRQYTYYEASVSTVALARRSQCRRIKVLQSSWPAQILYSR